MNLQLWFDIDNGGLTNYKKYSYNMPEDHKLTKYGPYLNCLNPINPDTDKDS